MGREHVSCSLYWLYVPGVHGAGSGEPTEPNVPGEQMTQSRCDSMGRPMREGLIVVPSARTRQRCCRGRSCHAVVAASTYVQVLLAFSLA